MSPLQQPRMRSEKAVLPPGAVPDGTRRRILEVALQRFASEGFHGTSVRDIVKVLEMQPSAIYAHFPSKEHILSELVRLGHEVLELALEAALRDAGDDPVTRVRALVRTHAVLHATYPHLAVVVNEEIRFLTSELAAPALALRAQSASLLRRVVEDGIAAGAFSPPDTAATAAAISAMGVRIPYWYDAPPGLDIEALAEAHVELALRMLGAAKPKLATRRA